MGDAIKKLLTSKRSLIAVLTAVFNCALAILAAVGYSHDPVQASAIWLPIIGAVALLVSTVATQLIRSYGTRDPGQLPGSGSAVLLFVLMLGASGCVQGLRGPAFDHSVQTQTIAERCRTPQATGGYAESPCSDELQRDLDAMARQAEGIEAFANGEKASQAK